MKSLIYAVITTLAMTGFAGHSKAAFVSLDFTNIGMESGSATTYSSTGDVWRATNVDANNVHNMDALFTITGVTNIPDTTNVGFVNGSSARGNNLRLIVGLHTEVANAHAFVNVMFVDAGTSDPYTGFVGTDQMIAQFSDIDSDVGANRSDLAGLQNGQFQSITLAPPNLTLLEVDTSIIPGYTIGVMQTPWTPQGNVIDTDAEAQSPVTIAFNIAAGGFDLVAGTTGPDAGRRHIDLDMTPDFIIIPEPGMAGIMLLMAAGVMLRRSRRQV